MKFTTSQSTSSQNENDPSGSVSDDPVFKVQLKSEKEKWELERVDVPIQRTVSTHKYCCVCFETKDLTIIPEEARTQSYVKQKIYIPAGYQ